MPNYNQQQSTTMVVLPQECWECILSQLEEMKDMLVDRNRQDVNDEWLTSAEARMMLGVSQKTWQAYRDNRVIPFSQVGRKIYVRRGDIETFMLNHKIKSVS